MFRVIYIFLIVSFTISICTKSLFAQGELDTEAKKLVFKNEKTFAILLNTNGFGGNYRYAKRLDGFSKRLYDIEFNIIKHPKEIKTQNPYFDTNQRRYVFGKTNSFFNLRLALGKQKEIFSKFDKGGLSIIYFYSFGPVIGFLKPIYYEVLYPVDSIPYNYVIRTEKFNTSIHRVGDIYGKAPFTVGTEEIKIIPGFFTKFGISFEYGKSDRIVHSIDVGASIEAYTQKIDIMATEENNQVLISLFASYRFGKAVSKRLKNIEKK
ncbi:MAG: hypothetical protein A2033_06030 [Bacteroidetes bacterium GWA2_31_9]|nr:MAG: hypothetical protein A2033_06030 [Bacteroidetes bacterium GWA2_31_9]